MREKRKYKVQSSFQGGIRGFRRYFLFLCYKCQVRFCTAYRRNANHFEKGQEGKLTQSIITFQFGSIESSQTTKEWPWNNTWDSLCRIKCSLLIKARFRPQENLRACTHAVICFGISENKCLLILSSCSTNTALTEFPDLALKGWKILFILGPCKRTATLT